MLLLAFGIGAMLIGLWLVVRFPSLGPSSLYAASINLAVAMAGGWLIGPVAGRLAGLWAPLGVYGALFLVVLPSLAYLFWSIGWFMRSLQGLIARGGMR
jgi:hypothetical protein